jgi:hypothetical protein
MEITALNMQAVSIQYFATYKHNAVLCAKNTPSQIDGEKHARSELLKKRIAVI